MPIFDSKYLTAFYQSMLDACTEEDRDALWDGIEKNPVIEAIPDQTEMLVTFLYRLTDIDLDGNASIYFLSSVTGYDFTEQSKFSLIPNTDIAYLSLVLPCNLRTVYNLVKRYDDDSVPLPEVESAPAFYPIPVGESAKFETLLNDLFAKKRVETDPRNLKEIIYYKDMDNPGDIYGKESILELRGAPCLEDIPTSFESSKAMRDRLRAEGRLTQNEILFADTCLGNVPGYDDVSAKRKYWIYLPKDYDPNAVEAYPFMVFLDGSSYLDYIPVQSILEKMIGDGIIPPCVAIFLDSPDGLQRSIEYNCYDRFTEFLTKDFIEMLRREKHALHITSDPSRTTIIGASYGGLAAFYAGLTQPNIFGHVIAQSPAFLAQRLSVLDKMVTDFSAQNHHASFILEMGTYENNIAEFEFEDGSVQAMSSMDAVRHVSAYMRQQGIQVVFHEFVGGHNYVCYRVSLYDRLKEVYSHLLEPIASEDRALRRK